MHDDCMVLYKCGDGSYLSNLIFPSYMSQVCVDHLAQFILVNIPKHLYIQRGKMFCDLFLAKRYLQI